MRKKSVFWIVLVVVVVLVVAALVFWGGQYYESRYVGENYYTMVPLDYDVTPQPLLSMTGEETGATGVTYTLMAYNSQGEARIVEFAVLEEDGNAPQPGTFLWISASEQIVVDWGIVEENNIPERALEMIRDTIE